MRVVYTGRRIDGRTLVNLLNRHYLPEYNVALEYTGEGGVRRLWFGFRVRLSTHVKYNRFSQSFSGKYDIDPAYGYASTNPHYYHYALVLDQLVFVLEELRKRRYIEWWSIRSPLFSFDSSNPDWRSRIPVSYDPHYDPAFVRYRDSYFQCPYSVCAGLRVPVDPSKYPTALMSMFRKFVKGELDGWALVRATEFSLKLVGLYSPVKGNPIIEAVKRFTGREMGEREVVFWLADASDEEIARFKRFYNKYLKENYPKIRREEVPDRVVVRFDDSGFPLSLAERLVREPYVIPQLARDKEKLIGWVTYRDEWEAVKQRV